ncbi:hypothetical protein Poly30_52070 [Planctomycetes bacterium Poly30]|uniref:Uncharacterized protein n=1 Tax=Saltatorellus ferox TaxID=2528018 RepID=A0A518EZZ6_9BACT|nr:hypothetical protein Poly30_52070 [Planctomycetes bacterium Poly30]
MGVVSPAPWRAWLTAAAAAVVTFLVVRALLPDREQAAPAALRPEAARSDNASVLEADAPLVAPPRSLTIASASESAVVPEESASHRPESEPLTNRAAAAVEAQGGPLEPRSALLYGKVVDARAVALGSVLVHLRTPDGSMISTRSDAAGRYALGPLAIGSWTVTPYAEGRHCPVLKVEIDGDTGFLRRDLVLPAQQAVRILVVTRGGEPAVPILREAGLFSDPAALAPVATLERPGEMIGLEQEDLWQPLGVGTVVSWQSSDAERDPAEFVRLAIHESGPTWISLVSHHCVLATRRVTEEVEEVRFVVDPDELRALRGTVQATIVDAETGAPLSARVALDTWAHFDERSALDNDPSTGASSLEDVPPGPLWWTARAEGRADFFREVVLPKGGLLDLGVIRLQRPVALAGSVRDADGQPIESVFRLGTLDATTGAVAAIEGRRFASDPDGRFRIEGLAPTQYVLQVAGVPARPPRPFDPRLRSAPMTVDARSGDVEELRLTVTATTHVTFPTGKLEEPWPFLEAIDENGLAADTTWVGRWFAESWIDLLPGDYALRIRMGDGSVLQRELTVGAEPLQFDLNLAVDAGAPAPR